MSRPVQPLGTYGSISVRKVGPKYAATARYRDMDGVYFRIQATGPSETKATNALKAKIAEQTGTAGDSDLDRNTSLRDLASYWLAEVRVTGRQAPQTLDAYERSLEAVVLPALGQLRLRELTVGRVDRFLKALAPDHPSRARRAKIVLALAFDLAVRHDAVGKNPVRDTAAVPRGRKEIRSLHHAELARLRSAVANWRTGEKVHGPKPDGQLADVIETILGTSARIGEALAIRKCDVDMTVSPPEVTISGTLVQRRGMVCTGSLKSSTRRTGASLPCRAIRPKPFAHGWRYWATCPTITRSSAPATAHSSPRTTCVASFVPCSPGRGCRRTST